MLTISQLEFWYGLVRRFENTALSFKGLTYAEAAKKFWIECVNQEGGWKHLTLEEQLAWEAVFRHLTLLVDNDEVQSGLVKLEQVEQSWRGWMEKRLPKKEPEKQASLREKS